MKIRRELIYIWINRDINGCFNQMGFNFSPQFKVKFDVATKKIIIEKTNKSNVFKDQNITNISALIGENGTGKTTLLNYLNVLSEVPLKTDTGEYGKTIKKNNEIKKYIAVYFEDDINEFKIINHTEINIFDETGKMHPPCSRDDFVNKAYIEKNSHLYFSNSEFTKDDNMRSDKINHLTLSNAALKYLANDFYKKQFNVQVGLISDSEFNALQTMFSNKMTVQDFQSILDIKYYNYLDKKEEKFIGKNIKNIEFSLSDINLIINEEDNKAHYDTEYVKGAYIKIYKTKYFNEIKKIIQKKSFGNILIYNLLGELIFNYDFKLLGTKLDMISVYKQCIDSVNLIENLEEKKYYEIAIKEINCLSELINKEDIHNNLFPESSFLRTEYYNANISSIYSFIKNAIDNKNSFILKYLKVRNLEQSSGERAILNFMSRLYFASKINEMIPEEGFELQSNILILIDEIDLYLHPEWQRKIIFELIKELQEHFKDKYFQIILTSHSPIIMSDIPYENSIFLKKNVDVIEQLNREVQTFGANIYTLYKDAFFIEDGLGLGEFSKHYINKLISDIRKQSISINEAKDKLNYIGEPIIRKKIYQMLGDDKPNIIVMEENEKKQILDFLKQQRIEIDRQISILGGCI